MPASSSATLICSRRFSLINGIRDTCGGLTQNRTIKNTPKSPILSTVAVGAGRSNTSLVLAKISRMIARALSISASNAIRTSISKRIRFLAVKLMTSAEATVELGKITVILSRVKIWVVRRAICTTLPSFSLMLTQSPT